MEETQRQQELDETNPSEDQGGIRRRLRDRELLKKRKAEAEEKETNLEETQTKRSRAGGKSGTRKRGRPRKNEPTEEAAVTQEEPAVGQEAVAVVAGPPSAEVIPDQTSSSLTPSFTVGGVTLEARPVPEPLQVISDQSPGSLTPSFAVGGVTVVSQPVPVAPSVLPTLAPLQSSDLAPPQSYPAPVDPAAALFSPYVPVPAPFEISDTAPSPVQESATGPVPSVSEAPAPARPPTSDPPQVKTLYAESQDRDALVLIEDIGPDEEEDIYPSQDKRGDEDLSEKPLNGAPEQNKIFSDPTLSSPPPPQEYLPQNLF